MAGVARAQAVGDVGGSARGAVQAQQAARIQELQQLELDTRERANEAVPVGQRLYVDYGLYLQLQYLSTQDLTGDHHVLRQGDLIPYARFNIDGAQEVFIRGRIGYRDFNKGDSFTGRGDEPNDGDLDRGYYKIDFARYNGAYGKNVFGAKTGQSNLTFEGGRDFAYWGNGLVLAQTIDGAFLDLQRGAFDLQLLGGVTPVRTVDFDTSRPEFDYNTRRGFYGAMMSLKAGDHRPYVYGLIQRDYNKEDELSLGIIDTKYDYNSWYLGVGSSGALTDNLKYGVEFAYEGGDTLSNSFTVTGLQGLFPIDQTRDAIQAFAFDGRLDYLVNDRHDTRLSFEVTGASGDSDRGSSSNTFNGNAPGTKDHSFNSFGLLNTGLAFAPQVSNVLVVRVGGATFPFSDVPALRRLQIGTDLLILNKFNQDAPIDEPTNRGERYLGVEPDVYLNWEVTSDITLALRYGIFFPDDRAFQNHDPRQFVFVGMTFSF